MKDVNILTSNGVNVEQSLELFGDMEMYDETLNDFLDMVEEKLANLEKFKLSSDMPNYAIEVHSLKSDARYLGFTTLADLCYQSEMKSKAGDVIFIQDNHPAIVAETRRMINVSNTYLGKASAPVAPASQPAAPQQMAAPVEPMAQSMPQPMVQPVTPQPMAQPVAPQQMAPAGFTPVAPPPGFQPVAAPTGMPPVAPAPANPSYGAINTQMGPAPVSYPGTMQAQPVAPRKNGTILVVDDSNLVANFVKKIFDIQYDVILANDGQKAIEIIDNPEIRSKLKCCLLDLNMPKVDGFAVLDHFKQNNYFVKLPVAVVSGVEDNTSIDRVNLYPIIDILSKPFNERDVKSVVEKCLATYF